MSCLCGVLYSLLSRTLLGKFGKVRFYTQAGPQQTGLAAAKHQGKVTPAEVACRDVIGTPQITCKHI